MTENEKRFVRTVVDFGSNVKAAQNYIKENFNIDSVYNEEDATLKLSCSDAFEALNLVAAKSYIQETFDGSMLTPIF